MKDPSAQNPTVDSRPGTAEDARTLDSVHATTAMSRQWTGKRIGRYLLRRQLGEGGMGEVWLAEQTEPIRRRVAVKIIKAGMDTRAVVSRFESERQVLALLDHPNIARVYDAGATENGRPYFVMEFIEGEPITTYCDRLRLSIRDRLELFFQVCEGVQHAHRNAVLHRDLKPHNVLVAIQDDRPVPKIIDFGVAKATDGSAVGEAFQTEVGQMIGTPEYMSPEQAEMSNLGIDTRTDVYALGVLLYELLVGELPFASAELRRSSHDEIRRRIREEEPPRPSRRYSELGDASEAVARARRTDPDKLAARLRGDIDWIILRALEKDRIRRYGTPDELADDLRRHLNDEPVVASPPSTVYRVRKFARRHKVGVGFASVVLVLLIALATTMSIQAGRIARERDRANREAALAAREAETASQVSAFLIDLFEVSDPDRTRGATITAREILDQGAERIETELADRPAIQATLMRTIGQVYTELGLFDESLRLLRRAVALHEALPPGNERELATSRFRLAKLLTWLGGDAEAEGLARRALAMREELLGLEHEEVAECLNALGIALQHLERYDESTAAHRRALAIRETIFGPDAPEVAVTLHNLAIVHFFKDELAEAEVLYRRSADIEKRHLGPDNHGYATSLHTLAIVCQYQERFDEALELELESLDIRQRVLGPDHYHVALSLATLGEIYREMGRTSEAVDCNRRAVEIAEPALGADHEEVLWMKEVYGLALAAAAAAH
ncbi:serine/threonine protein kinase [bacterium]|nr:serine/threonine protein kinase [bacterium]